MQQQLCGPADNAEPVSLLRKGKHVMISTKDGVPCVGTRLSTAFFQGYTFTKRPLTVGDRYVVQITKTSQLYVGSLSFGVTCCDPNTVRVGELPDDPNQLVDRPEYWVMSRNVAEDTRPGDLLTFTINDNGNRKRPLPWVHDLFETVILPIKAPRFLTSLKSLRIITIVIVFGSKSIN